MEVSADGDSVPSNSRSGLVSQVQHNRVLIFPWRRFAFLMEKLLMFAIWSAILNRWVCSHITNVLQQLGFEPIRFTPYVVLFAIMMLRWAVKSMEARHRLDNLHQRPPGQMVQIPPRLVICPREDGVRLVEGWYRNLFGETTCDSARDMVNQDSGMQIPMSNGVSPGSVGGEAQDMINQHLGTNNIKSNQLSNGSNGEGARDVTPAILSTAATESKTAERISWFKGIMKSPGQSSFHDEVVVAIPNKLAMDVRVKGLAKTYDANLLGSRVLHRRIEIGPDSGNSRAQLLPLQILECLRIARTLDRDSTVQLGSYAIMKYTDAGLSCCMLEEDWTPTIFDIHRSSQSFLEFLTGECATWTIRGKNLQNAALSLATAEKSENVPILQQYETGENGIDVILFKETRSLPMFLNKMYISASNLIKVEKGVTFKLHSQAKEVRRASWISVVDGLIPSTWTTIVMTSLSLLGGSIHGTRWKSFVACCFAIAVPIVVSTYYLVLRNQVPPQGGDIPSHGATHTLGANPNTCDATPRPSAKDAAIQKEVAPFSNLACEEKSNELQLLNEDEVLNLAGSLSNEDNLDLQEKVTKALWCSECNEESCKLHTLKESEFLATLVRSLSEHSNPIFQSNAADVLLTLAGRGESAIAQILNEKGALTGLVRALSKDDNPNLQAKAAGALFNLAIGGESMKWRIVHEEGALAGLVRSLSKDDNPELQKMAARALGRLAYGSESIKWQILKKDGALTSLVNSLSKQDNPDLEENAARALLSLASGKESIKLKIMNEDGALVGLVRSLSRHDNPGLAANSAGALWYLACGGELMKFQILNADKTLASLVRSLSMNNNPSLETNAAGALWYLAYGGESIKLQILNENGGLAGLVRCLSNQKNPNLAANAAGALWTLADGGDPMKLKVTNEEGALTSLVRALSRDNNANLQTRASGTLLSLATGGDFIKLQIVNACGALEGLVESLSKHDNPKLQANVAGTLWILALGTEAIQIQITNEDGALSNLMRSLSNKDNPDLQVRARGALKALDIKGVNQT